MDDVLQKYIQKRNFKKTPEPGGVISEELGSSSFVVHRHDARSLHYDLRISHRGRLVCWAVPKGFTYDPSVKHLAVHTEDHPIQYISFEGIIPKGEYGAGSMNIWDIGTYRTANGDDINAALLKGEVKIQFSGRKLRGEWHLVKLKKSGKDEWLIFKARDGYQDPAWDALLALDLSQQPEAPPPERIAPMTYREAAAPFTDPEWAFEIFHEGARAVCVKNGAGIRFIGDGGVIGENEFLTERLSFMRSIAPERAVIDGTIIALGGNGLSSRNAIKEVIAAKTAAPLYYYMADILNFEGYDVTTLPYRERKKLLALLGGSDPRLQVVDFLKGAGELFSEEARKAGVAAVLAKRIDSPYEEGASDRWRLIDLRGALPAGHGAGAAGETAAVAVSHPDKIFFPEAGLTKKDLVSYYNDIADIVLPYLKDRPVHILRFPDGIGGNSFYQKHLPGDRPDYFEYLALKESEPPYFICRNRQGLLHLINLGSIDLHIWFSRKNGLEHPDWIAWDLDAKQASFGDVIKVAREIGKILHGIGLVSFVKTSGKTGLHILVPVEPRYTYEQTRLFAEGVARIVARDNASIATVERVIETRGNRVYIDYLQNRRGQTLALPYAVRPVPEATVSMPVEWDDLERGLSPGQFTLKNAADRIARKGDIFHDVLTTAQSLNTAIMNLDRYVQSISSGGK